jgi:hypothetical protein
VADAKLDELTRLLTERHPDDKIIIFTQYADTVRYLTAQLRARGIDALEGVTGDSPDPTAIAWRFSPVSNDKRNRVRPDDELRVLVATDVLSEGQNLQDCAIVVNYDLPWAIIRLIQRVGRVDRIGQKARQILAYTFLPAEGIEQVIRLRARVVQRLRENAEVVGTDELFFEDGAARQPLLDLYNEKAGALDGDAEGEVDLASQAFQIWKNAIEADPSLEKAIRELPDVIYSSRAHTAAGDSPNGVLVYMRTSQGNDALGWTDRYGNNVTQSQLRILQAAACHPQTPALPRNEQHHALVQQAVEQLARDDQSSGGQLGRPSGARYKTYVRLQRYADEVRGTLFDTPQLKRAIDDIYRYPLYQSATDTLNRQIRSGISDDRLAELVVDLRGADRLCIIHDEGEVDDPHIICSLGLWGG